MSKTHTSETKEAIRLLLVDDHEMVRLGLRSLFADAAHISIVGEASGVSEAIAQARLLKPDVVLLDLRLADGSGVDACRELVANQPAPKILFLSAFSDRESVLSAILAGASGYLLKDINPNALLNAVRTVATGLSILDPQVTNTVLSEVQAMATGAQGSRAKQKHYEDLSPQERRVLTLVVEGRTNKEIAHLIGLSDKTVKNYLSHIFQKLNIGRRSEAAARFSHLLKQASDGL
jgi:two-component system, NarL family, response regulator DevR